MKKGMSLLLAVLMLSVICILAFAVEKDRPKTSADEKWWEWFQTLSPEQQACVNFRPAADAAAAEKDFPVETESQQRDN